jgi:hypothetical protein
MSTGGIMVRILGRWPFLPPVRLHTPTSGTRTELAARKSME